MNAFVDSPNLVFTDIQSGGDYLSALPLANPVAAEEKLTAFLDALLAAPPDPGILFSLLEQARVPLCFVEEEMARRYYNRPLPLSDDEETCFQQVVAAWRKMARAYAMCAQMEEPATASAQFSALMATILHRCLYYTGMVILEHYRARRELPAGTWIELHGFYETAEEWQVAYTPVEDTLENNLQASHCAAAYATLLLIDVASPYSNSVRNLNLIRRWAGMWSPLISLHRLDDELELPPYIVELMKDAPLHPSSTSEDPGKDARRLDMTRLGLQVNHMLSQLRHRVTPAQLGLGEETSGHVIQLLEHLSRPWTQAASPRRFRRFATQGFAKVAVSFEAMHFCVSGKPFEQPDIAIAYSRKDFDQLFTFRDRADPGAALIIRPPISYPVDEWSVINHSANGFRLGRSKAGQKLAHGQLLVVCPHDGDRFLLAQATWLMEDHSGGLLVGLATLPGMPQAIGVRQHVQGAASGERYVRAFMLPAMPAILEEGSVVLPAGIYTASKVLDVFHEESHWQIRLMHILQRGTDFDRVSFQMVNTHPV